MVCLFVVFFFCFVQLFTFHVIESWIFFCFCFFLIRSNNCEIGSLRAHWLFSIDGSSVSWPPQSNVSLTRNLFALDAFVIVGDNFSGIAEFSIHIRRCKIVINFLPHTRAPNTLRLLVNCFCLSAYYCCLFELLQISLTYHLSTNNLSNRIKLFCVEPFRCSYSDHLCNNAMICLG